MRIPKLEAVGGRRTDQNISIGHYLGYPNGQLTRDLIIKTNFEILDSDDFNQTADQELDQAEIEREVERSRTEITTHGGDFVVWRQYILLDYQSGVITGYGVDAINELEELRKHQPKRVENINIVILRRMSKEQNKTDAYYYPGEGASTTYSLPQNLIDSLAEFDNRMIELDRVIKAASKYASQVA